MHKTHNFRKPLIAAALSALALGATVPASAEVNMFDGEWHFSVTPYAWLPNVNGSTSFDGPIGLARNVSADIDSNTVLSHLKFAAMISGEVRKGEWSVFTDYIYLSLDGQPQHHVAGAAWRRLSLRLGQRDASLAQPVVQIH